MKFLSKRFLFILISLVLVVAAFYVYSNFIKVEYTTTSELRSELAIKTESLSRYQIAFSKLQNMLGGSNIDQLKESVSRILPSSIDEGYLSAQLIGFAKLNGLSVMSVTNSIDPTEASKSKIIRSVGRIKTQVILRGSYSGLKAYIEQIENNLLLMDISSFSVSPQKVGSESNNSFPEYKVIINSYYQIK